MTVANISSDSLWDYSLNSHFLAGGVVPTKFFTIDSNNEAQLLKWCNDQLAMKRELRVLTGQYEQWRMNWLMYQGKFDAFQGQYRRSEDTNQMIAPRGITPKTSLGRILTNQAYEIVEQKTSHMARFKPNVEIIPANDEKVDRVSAEYGKVMKQHLTQVLRTERQFERAQRYKYIYGETLLMLDFNPSLGPVHPSFKVLENGKKLLGKEIFTDAKVHSSSPESINEKPFSLDTAVHVGEVVNKIYPPTMYYHEPVMDYEESDYRIIEEIVDIQWLEAKYDTFDMDKYNADKVGGKYYNGYGARYQHYSPLLPEGKIRIYKMYHKATELVYKGAFVEWIEGQILSNAVHPHNHKQLPGVVLTDVDVPTELHAMSTVELIGPLNRFRNGILSSMARNISMLGKPMIFAKQGTVQFKQFKGAITVINYNSEQPRVASFPVVTSDMFNLLSIIDGDIEKVGGVHGVSRGEPPPGIRAGIALNFLEEQENKLANSSIIKTNQAIEDYWTQALSLAGQYYQKDDGRTAKILGEHGKFTAKSLDEIDLDGPFSVIVQNASALPESKAGRLQSILDLREILGEEAVPTELVMDVIDLARPEKLVSNVTTALRRAQDEDQEMLKGRDIKPPEYHEESLVHWMEHTKTIQSSQFIDDVPEDDKTRHYEHIEATEMHMIDKMLLSDGFASRLSELTSFPLFAVEYYKQATQPPPAPEVPPEALGAPPIDPAAILAGAGEVAPNQAPVPIGAPVPQGAPVGNPQVALPADIPLGDR